VLSVKIVNTAMADDSVWPWQHARARHAASQDRQAVNATGRYSEPVMAKL